MANEQRIRRNYMYGTIDIGNPQNMNIGDVTYTDASFAKIPAVPATAHFPITFEDAATGLYEIMYVITHTANSKTVTLRRAQEGTTQLVWGPLSKWVHAPTVRDYHGIGNARQAQFYDGANYPSNAFVRVGARDQGVKAYAGDIVELGFNVESQEGAFVFDFATFNGGKRVTTVSPTIFKGVTLGRLPGSRFERNDVYVDQNNVVGYHRILGSIPCNGVWQYQVLPADVSTAGTVTFAWLCESTPTSGTNSGPGGSFFTDSGDGYKQGAYVAGETRYNWLRNGVFWVKNLGPQFYPG